MPTPEKPDLDYSYTAFQEAQGNNTFPGTQLDNDLANLKASIDDTIDFAALVIRDDGKLNNGVVTKNSLAEDVLLGVPAPRPWVTATAYAVDDTVTTNNSLYICLIAHTSGVFATDYANGLWAQLAVWSPLTEVADNTVSTPKIVDLAVTTAKLAGSSVTTVKLADGAVTRAKVAANFGLMPVGASMEWDGPFAPAGWLFKFGQALSRSTYLELLNALTGVVIGNVANASTTVTGVSVDLRNLGLEGAPIEGPGVSPGTTIASVTLNTIVLSANGTANGTGVQLRIFPHGNGDGSTTFNLPDDRGRVSAGRDNMGGPAAGRLTASGTGNPGIDGARLGVAGGVDRHTLTQAQLPNFSQNIETALSHDHSITTRAGLIAIQQGAGATVNNVWFGESGTFTGTNGAKTTTVPSGGSDAAHPNAQPTGVKNKIIFTGVV